MATTLPEPGPTTGLAAADDGLDDLTPPARRNPYLVKYERYLYGAIGLAGFLVIWWAVVASGYVDKLYLATPQDTFTALINGLADGSLAQEILPSVQRALTGFVIGLIAGIGLGIAVGYVRIVQQFLEPVLLFFRNLSLLALLPVFVVFFGIGEQSKIAIVVWACFWPIFITTVGAVNGVERILLNAARTLGAGRGYIFTRVVLPAAIPGIFPGIRLASANAFTALVAAELVGGAHGIGIYINNAALRYQTPEMYAGIITLGLIGILVNAVMTGVEHKATAWQKGLTNK
ncbi:NitT/TauT family transport system permease protein [Gordonia amarae]|uniref:Putative ABC transporter permease protein n=1 Tax=Gordonia amarae NBRC 15530 TaxID=1075090 RepID=G7GTY8_9ACTN|nr:ABC transporter permease [Gordonia amarae]MCS3877709.1 NitT/TauT family transport system permease protein [Gordonia amarae]GAB07063.1 putative ABC transporter permease protein [Gordonia amarae NBRC 15530]